jgi:hypothetical protein
MMLDPWKPRGAGERTKVNVGILIFPYESQRDAVVMSAIMCGPQRSSISVSELRLARSIALRGGYGIVSRPVNAFLFKELFLDRAREFHTEAGWPYAWRIARAGSYGYERVEAGRSPDTRGQNLRDVIKRSIDDLIDGTYKEKGVTYG